MDIKEMNEGLEWKSALEVMEKYSSKLSEISEGCVELYGVDEHPFDWMLVPFLFLSFDLRNCS